MTTDSEQSEEFTRLRKYLVSQTKHRDWWELFPRVIGPRIELLDKLRNTSQAQALWKPAANEWTILETSQHLLNSSFEVRNVVEKLANGKLNQIDKQPNQDTLNDETTIFDLRKKLTMDAIKWAGMLDILPLIPDDKNTWPHMSFGKLTSREWFLFQRLHDRDHLNQIDKICASFGFPGD